MFYDRETQKITFCTELQVADALELATPTIRYVRASRVSSRGRNEAVKAGRFLAPPPSPHGSLRCVSPSIGQRILFL